MQCFNCKIKQIIKVVENFMFCGQGGSRLIARHLKVFDKGTQAATTTLNKKITNLVCSNHFTL